MKKSMPLSVTVAEPSQPPKLSFLFNTRRTWVMGVLNVTPDSFYAGSRHAHLDTTLTAAQRMMDEGADVLDIGGESTRPGAEEISESVEIERVLPVIQAIHQHWPHIPISIDTQKAAVALQALDAGASIVNDVSALRNDSQMADVVADAGCPVILMHMQGTPRTMQKEAHYQNVTAEVKQFFEERLDFAIRHKIKADRVILDPGIGFGKTLNHNMTLLKNLSTFLSLGRPLLVGVSRKSFIGRLLAPSSPHPFSLKYGEGEEPSPYFRERVAKPGEGGILPPEERLEGSIAAGLWAVREGAAGLRVHDVGPTHHALQVWEGLRAS